MKNLNYHDVLTDIVAKKQYAIKSHRQLNDEEIGRAVRKKSLQRILRTGKIAGYEGIYEIIEVLAADGWEDAE